MSDIHYLLSQAMTDRGHSFEICWQGPNNEYVLSVEASTRGGDANWKMFPSLSKASQPLWTYVSCDVLLVHNLVKSTAGEAADDAAPSSHNIETMVRRDVIASESKKKSKAFSGDLSLVQMPTLIQSILMAKMTGVLDVEDPDGRGLSQVFFVDGAAVHCVASDSYGEEGVLELLSWKEGNFHFEPNKTNEVRTIKAPLDSLLLKGMTIIDNAAFISNLGVTNESHLVRSHGDLTDAELEERTKKGAPVNMAKQKQLYRMIEPETTLGQILDKLKWPRSQWVPILANLMRTELVTVNAPAASEVSTEPQVHMMEPKRVDKQLIQSVMMSLRSQETGLFTYAAFLYFLEQEYFRAYRSSNPMSVVIFQMGIKGPEPAAPREPLPLSALCAAVRRISSAKRHVDLLAHYESYDYVALLPNTAGSGAKVFATRVLKVLTQEPLIPASNPPFTFTATFGIASIPEDFTELSQLLAAAEIAKTEASNGPEPIVLFKDIKHRYEFPGTTQS